MWGRGTVLGGRYTLTERVGSGGMGEVWRADDGVLKQQVAVKIMQPALLADRSFTERFRREARLPATLRHPGIVHVHDYAEPADDADEQIAYIVMEFIDGRPLNSVLADEGPMVPARALGLLADALGALHAAHQQDIVHRDLKPSNLMVRSDGGVTVTDFGIAHAMAGTKITTTNSVLGTALYIAPEQADGKSTTPLCDLYSIGVVCFELLTGRLPFTGETVLEIVLKHIQQPPPRLSDEIPRAVRDFVATALAKDPAQRFPDAGAMAAAARAAAARPGAGQPVREPTVFATVPEPVPREAPQAETPRTAPTEPAQHRRSRLIVPIIIPVVISAGVGSVVLIEQAPWQSRAQGAGPQPSVAAPFSPGAASAAASGTGGTGAASPPPGGATSPQAVPGQQPGNPVSDQSGAGAAGGGAAGGAGAGTGTAGAPPTPGEPPGRRPAPRPPRHPRPPPRRPGRPPGLRRHRLGRHHRGRQRPAAGPRRLGPGRRDERGGGPRHVLRLDALGPRPRRLVQPLPLQHEQAATRPERQQRRTLLGLQRHVPLDGEQCPHPGRRLPQGLQQLDLPDRQRHGQRRHHADLHAGQPLAAVVRAPVGLTAPPGRPLVSRGRRAPRLRRIRSGLSRHLDKTADHIPESPAGNCRRIK
ncbi:serine/threonine-protein kinase [Streptomyces sp. TLI_235]|nr:protein kinase [Streptomyces sp. TLI_235]PBC76017.1 serine/threonine-protein kinase [Streptomyces sp. TLI_235]